uniref:U4/U6 small nuclear ribonucleoprotein Prp3 n=1 Tax=Magallana gigas TaxID=29159 RepID=K1PJQ0_MAGGI
MSLSSREWEDLKSLLDKAVHKFLGFTEQSLVTAALNCIDKGYDKKKTISKLEVFLDDRQAEKFSEKLFDVWDDYRNKSQRKKRKDGERERDEASEKKKRRFVDDGPVEMPVIPGPGNPSPGQLTGDKGGLSHNEILMNEALEKVRRAQELQAKIQNQMSGLMQGPTPLILDAEGRTIDAKTGQTVQLTHHTPTLKANIRAKRREQFKELIEKPTEEITVGKYFDPRVGARQAQRPKRGFKFHEQGKFEAVASRLRAKVM